MWRVYVQENLNRNPWAQPWVRRAQGQPSWPFKVAAAVVMLVFVTPLVLLTLAALAVGAMVLLILLAVAAVAMRLAVWWHALTGRRQGTGLSAEAHDDLRENVRVIHHDR